MMFRRKRSNTIEPSQIGREHLNRFLHQQFWVMGQDARYAPNGEEGDPRNVLELLGYDVVGRGEPWPTRYWMGRPNGTEILWSFAIQLPLAEGAILLPRQTFEPRRLSKQLQPSDGQYAWDLDKFLERNPVDLRLARKVFAFFAEYEAKLLEYPEGHRKQRLASWKKRPVTRWDQIQDAWLYLSENWETSVGTSPLPCPSAVSRS